MKLKQVAVFASGGTPDSNDPKYWAEPGEGTPWVVIGDMSHQQTVVRTVKSLTQAGLMDRRLRPAPPGTVLFAMYASVGAVAMLGIPAVWNQALLGITARPGRADERFIAYWLRHYAPQATALTNASTQPNLNAAQVADFPFPEWDLENQRRIADFLDDRVWRVDQIVTARRRQVEMVRQQSGRADEALLIPRARVQDRRNPTDVPLADEIPSDWQVRPLGMFLRGITYGFTNPMPSANEGPYMLTANDIGDGVVRYSTARHTTPDAFENLLTAKSRPEPGDVLLTKDGTLGRVALFDGPPSCVNQSVAVLSPDRSVVRPRLLAQALGVPIYRAALIFEAGGTTIKHLYITRVVKQRVGLPPLSEQAGLEHAIDQSREAHTAVESALEASIRALTEYKQSLITAAVTGEFDVTTASTRIPGEHA